MSSGSGPRTQTALAEIEASLRAAWAAERASRPQAAEATLAREILERPDQHEWRLVDAAMGRLGCEECGARLGAGPRGCESCDMADGFRFAAREVDRAGVPPGNEHAIRVSSAVLRAPHRWPGAAVRGNEVFLPLFMAGLMPTREQQEQFEAAAERGLPDRSILAEARTFEELVRLAQGTRSTPPSPRRGGKQPR